MIIFMITLSSCYIGRAYKYRNFYLKDLDKMAAAELPASPSPFYFYSGTAPASFSHFLDTNLSNTYTYGFLVIRNDSILYEKYFDNLHEKSLLPSFSVAKSFVATLIQMAHEEGKIKSLQEPITHYLPFLLKKDKAFANITIQHLLDMRSGIKSNENYDNPFSDVLKLGFTKNLEGKIKKLRIEKAPGQKEYKSVNTQLLAMITEQATGKKIQEYLIEKIWQPLGMETTATWNIDSKRKNTARAFCCINATARDFAKLGRLYLNNGNWNGKQLISPDWVNTTVNTDSMRKYEGYKNQWWGGNSAEYFTDSLQAVTYAAKNNCTNVFAYTAKNGVRYYGARCASAPYLAEGILGQYVFVHPAKRLIIVRLGHYWKHPGFNAESFIYQAARQL